MLSRIFYVCAIAALTCLASPMPKDTTDKPLPQGPGPLPNLYLVTTSQINSEATSAELADVSATSLFDPYYQKEFLLRLIGDDYNSLPQFNMTKNGFLSTLSEGIAGHGEYIYNSTVVQTGAELQFIPSEQTTGNLGLRDGYLLTVDNQAEGWVICDGELEEKVISWKGLDTSCEPTYIQAVYKPPY